MNFKYVYFGLLQIDTFLYIILQQLSSFIDWAENWRYIENSFHIVPYSKKIKKSESYPKFFNMESISFNTSFI